MAKTARQRERLGRWRTRLGRAALALAASSAAACGESSFDIYMRGLAEIEAADRGPCQMEVDAGGAMVISSAKIIECLEANQAALRTIEDAKARGFEGKDVERVIAQLNEKIEKLESRRSVVGYMERESELP